MIFLSPDSSSLSLLVLFLSDLSLGIPFLLDYTNSLSLPVLYSILSITQGLVRPETSITISTSRNEIHSILRLTLNFQNTQHWIQCKIDLIRPTRRLLSYILPSSLLNPPIIICLLLKNST